MEKYLITYSSVEGYRECMTCESWEDAVKKAKELEGMGGEDVEVWRVDD